VCILVTTAARTALAARAARTALMIPNPAIGLLLYLASFYFLCGTRSCAFNTCKDHVYYARRHLGVKNCRKNAENLLTASKIRGKKTSKTVTTALFRDAGEGG